VLITAPTEEIGEQVAEELVKQNLAACVNILPKVSSVYRWEGDIVQDGEFLLMVKTRNSLFEQLAGAVMSLHPYKVPEVIAIPIVAGTKEYLSWIDAVTA
jgi:periplasmic divalent cation tolerance protein